VLGAAVRAGEERVLAGQRQRPDGALDHVIIDLDASVVEEAGDARPARERVSDCLGQLVLLRLTRRSIVKSHPLHFRAFIREWLDIVAHDVRETDIVQTMRSPGRNCEIAVPARAVSDTPMNRLIRRGVLHAEVAPYFS
jgi:hypothetical protein